MKLSRFSKRVIAIACSLAMVVAGLAFVPNSAKADDYSGLTYRDIVNNQNNEFDPTLKGSQYAVAEDDSKTLNILFQNVAFGELYISGGAWSAADLTATINGVENSVTPEGAGLRCFNCANYLDRKYNEIDVSWNGGTSKIIIYCPLKDDPETTTVDPSAPTTTAGPTTTTAEPTTPAASWKDIAGTNDIKYWSETKARVISYQKPGWPGLEEYGVYVEQPAGDGAPMTVTIDGVQTTIQGDGDKGDFYAMGAGLLFYASTLDKAEVTIQIHYAPNDDVELKFKNLNPTPTESQTETEEPSVEPSTEAPTETQAPTVTEAPSESESETETEAPASEWISANNTWLWVRSNGIVEDVGEAAGGNNNEVQGITAFYAGTWGHANIDVATHILDENELPLNVISPGYDAAWSAQCHINKTLDASKVYSVTLYWGQTVIYTDSVSYEASYQKTIDLNNLLSVGEDVLKVEFDEQEQPPEPPVVETITINPNTAQIAANHNIWASWSNPSGTAYTYAYLNSVGAGNSPIAANGWDFNTQAGQPMVGVDQVSRSRDNSIQIQPGGTYTLIVDSYNAFDQQTGHGELVVTIPALDPEEQEIQEYMAKINTSDNLAYQKTPVVAEGNNENTAGNICDGNKDSRWQANKTVDNTWFAVDLEGVYTVETVLVSWEASNATSYEIYTAGNDGVYGDDPVATVTGLDNNKAVIKLSKEIGVNARYVKVVVTGWSGNAEAYGISPYELAVFGGEVEGYYDVSDYKSSTPYTYPTKAGKIFAGWFTDDTCIEPYTGTTGIAYAKFIDEKVLGTKFQVANDGSAIRFLSSLDSMDYQSVGFKFTGHYGNAVITEKTKSVEKLYTKINADGTEVLPTVFSKDDSTYFFTYTVRGMTNAGTNSDWNVTPFYVTSDGTTVEGTSGVYPQN